MIRLVGVIWSLRSFFRLALSFLQAEFFFFLPLLFALQLYVVLVDLLLVGDVAQLWQLTGFSRPSPRRHWSQTFHFPVPRDVYPPYWPLP